MAYVPVPKDLSKVKTKVAFNLTKRQLICFSLAGLCGIPVYFMTRNSIGTSTASMLMVTIMLPFFFLGMYEKDGFPAEKIVIHYIKHKFLTQGIRTYKSENLYLQIEERAKINEEVAYLESKARGNKKIPNKKKRKKQSK